MAQSADLFCGRRARGTAAEEWRSIPPTINVRHKKRPPPLALHSTKQAVGTIPLQTQTPVWTPGPSSSAHTASSFTFSAPSQPSTAATLLSPFSIPSSGRARAVSAGPDPSADGGDKTRFYAVPEWQHSPDTEIDQIPLPSWLSVGHLAATAREAPAASPAKTSQSAAQAQAQTNRAPPPPPASPRNHLARHTWPLGDYFLLLSVMCVHARAWRRGAPIDWEHVADIVNAYVRPRAPLFAPPSPHSPQGQLALFGQGMPPRWTAWDCWHRWTVPWVSPREAPSREDANGTQDQSEGPTFEDAPGVQHRYGAFDMARTVEMYALLTRVLTVLDNDPSALLARAGTGPGPAPPPPAKPLLGPARHPAYPARTRDPHVPPRTFGNAQVWGLMPWFRKGAVNVATLEALFQGRPDAAAEERPGCVAERVLPAHLRALEVPPPPPGVVSAGRYGKKRLGGER